MDWSCPKSWAAGGWAGADLRGANQSLVFSGSGSAGASASAAAAACAAVSAAAAAAAPSSTVVRTTTGGIGREPGMLMRIRVVSVVSVLGSSGAAAPPASVAASWPPDPSSGAPGGLVRSCGCSEGNGRLPYGGVPDGYAAPPRPWGPEDELSVSRVKAGSPG